MLRSGTESSARDLVLVVGARPDFMKMAPLCRALAQGPPVFRPLLVHTGQHDEANLLEIFVRQLGFGAFDAYLDGGSGSHGSQMARMLERFEGYLWARPQPPAGIVVVGAADSTLACALAAVKLGIPVAHVEAGLRSGNRTIPEEINRIVTDSMADVLFVGEPSGEVNLRREGIPKDRVYYVGNPLIDSLMTHVSRARTLDMAGRVGVPRRGFALVTAHRPGNVDDQDRLERLVEFLTSLATRLPVVFPVHPRTRARLAACGWLEDLARLDGLSILPPLGYEEYLGLMVEARLLVTDSGGVQDEASFLGVPCLTLRSNTERPVTITHGTNTLIGTDYAYALSLVDEIAEGMYKSPKAVTGWDGRAAERIVQILGQIWGPLSPCVSTVGHEGGMRRDTRIVMERS